MKRLLLPLIAAIALPTAVTAESYWLLITDWNTNAFEKIEMKDMEQCEEQGKLYREAKLSGTDSENYVCLTGK